MIYIGTSGYNYSFWVEKFYPKDLEKSKWLEYYSKYFNTLELNSTFYHIPKASTISSWKSKLKKYNLKLSIKTNKQITHIFKLENTKILINFLDLFLPLKNNIGSILFQLPPSLRYDYYLLESFISNLNNNFKYAIEFRNKSWYNDKIFFLLKENNISLVWHDYNQPFVFEKNC